MAINVAGTTAVGDYLASEIVNARTLMGFAPQTDAAATAAASAGATWATTKPLTRAELQTQVLAQRVANTQLLFGIPGSSAPSAGGLPTLATQTPQQIASVALKSSEIESNFSNIATLFGSLGLGNTTNTRA